MYRCIIGSFLLIHVLSIFPTSWALIEENTHKTDIIEHSIGIPEDFYPQKLFVKFGLKYYYISRNEKVTWYLAMHKCHSIGGHLISLTDNVTLNEVSKLVKNNKYPHYWTDLSDLSQKGEYVSMTSGLKPSFLDWCENDTSSIKSNKNCVHIDNTKSPRPCMKTISCIDFQSYICESNIPRIISTVIW